MKYTIIGYGSRGYYYDELFRNTNNAELVAVCDKRQSRLDLCKTKNKNNDKIKY